MYKIAFFVPEESSEQVKMSMFRAGAGRIGNYDCCAWQVKGTGQFRPLEGSHPHFGDQDKTETVSEYKIEMVCEDRLIRDVVRAMKEAHPYEEVAYDVIKLEEI